MVKKLKSILVFSSLMVGIVGYLTYFATLKITPFESVRLTCDSLHGQIDGKWYEVTAINSLPVTSLFDRSRMLLKRSWTKRISEDLPLALAASFQPIYSKSFNIEVRSGDSIKSIEKLGTAELRWATKDSWSFIPDRKCGAGAKTMYPPVSTESIDFKLTLEKLISVAKLKGWMGSFVVFRNGHLIYESHNGHETLSAQRKNNINTKYRIASVSKQFTGAAVMLLAERNKLTLQDPICKWIQEFCTNQLGKITIYQLLTHTSGLPRISKDRKKWAEMAQSPTSVGEYVRLAVQQEPLFSPGDEFQYSNFGFRILSLVIEKASGQKFSEFMSQYVFEPTGMMNTGVASLTGVDGEVASGHQIIHEGGHFKPIKSQSKRNFGTGFGSGGIYTSPADILLWHNSLSSNTLFSEQMTQRYFTPVRENMAVGWTVKESNGIKLQKTSGANASNFCKLWRLPESDTFIGLFGNVEETIELDDLFFEFDRLLIGKNFMIN